jgi:hypothetical protein
VTGSSECIALITFVTTETTTIAPVTFEIPTTTTEVTTFASLVEITVTDTVVDYYSTTITVHITPFSNGTTLTSIEGMDIVTDVPFVKRANVAVVSFT